MVVSGVVMNWAVWGMLAGIGSFFFLMLAGTRPGHRRKVQSAPAEQPLADDMDLIEDFLARHDLDDLVLTGEREARR